MIQFNIDPYDMLIQNNVRVNLLETNLRESQQQLLEATKMLQQQNQLIKQLQHNEEVLSTAIGQILLKLPQ